MFDYGSPVGFRLALAHPERITAIIYACLVTNLRSAGKYLCLALVAAIPAALLLTLIAGFNVRIHVAALAALGACLLLAVGMYHMPVAYAAASTLYGAGYGLFPIGWLVLNIIFIYQLTVQRGLFDVLRRNLAQIAPDPRIQIILIAFAFGSFLEGMSGFGAPVAITAAILIQLGFRPLHASGLALVANTAPVAFGSLGIPLTTLQQVTDLNIRSLSATVGALLAIFSFSIPFLIVVMLAGWRRLFGIWPAALGRRASRIRFRNFCWPPIMARGWRRRLRACAAFFPS